MPGRSPIGASFWAFSALFALIMPSGASANWQPPATGYDLLRGMRLETYNSGSQEGLDAYANAVAGDAMVIGIFKSGLNNGRLCIKPDGIKYADVVLVVRAWLEQNTDLLSGDAAMLAEAALEKAFPC